MVGRLGRPVGLAGFVGLYVEPEDLIHFEIGNTVAVGESTLRIAGLRRGKKGHEVRFEEVPDRDSAELIRGLDVRVPERRRLAEGEFWPEQLRGLEVRPNGGTITGIVHGPAQARLVVQREGASFEVPFVSDLVPVVDLDAGYVEIVEIDGLSDPSSDH